MDVDDEEVGNSENAAAAEEVAAPIEFLASDWAGTFVGQVLQP